MTPWLPLTLFVLHIAEEWPRFPAWATRRFGVTSRAWYAYSHAVLVAMVAGVGWSAGGAAPPGWAVTLNLALLLTLAMNGLFHLAAGWHFREYSPGVVTGAGAIVPVAGYVVAAGLVRGDLPVDRLAIAAAIGAGVQALVLWSLTWRMDIDWRLRFRRPVGTGALERG